MKKAGHSLNRPIRPEYQLRVREEIYPDSVPGLLGARLQYSGRILRGEGAMRSLSARYALCVCRNSAKKPDSSIDSR